jgi:3-deoxy-D-manno-octulosonate 8-phosphate phosphatase (KDO 8-P phosphatase)
MKPVLYSSPAIEKIRDLLTRVTIVAFDFDGVFTNNTVYVTQNGFESIRCWRGDGIGLSRLHTVDVHTIILSTEINPVVTVRAQKLKTECRQGLDDKATAIKEFCHTLGVSPKQAAFVGNDINDIPALMTVGLPIAVFDAHPEILPYVLYHTVNKGGQGAVREVCDLIFLAKKGNLNNIDPCT